MLDFHLARGQTARADDELEGNADEVGGGELLASAHGAVVIERVYARRVKLAVELFVCGIAFGIAGFEVDEGNLKGRDRDRPDDTVFVVAGFDNGPYGRRRLCRRSP